jgi:threonine synthase
MTTVPDANVFNIAVNGTFDDCQNIVKQLFSDIPFKQKHSLGAVNSINWARVLAQVVYYFYAWLKVTATCSKNIVFSVPTGNFGDIFAGYVAKRMGLPVAKLILATNENSILTRMVNNGDYSTGEVVATLSPSMDIQVASNFERYLYYLFAENHERVNSSLAQFAATGKLQFSAEELALVQQDFSSASVNREETLQTINDFNNSYGYLLDPHTAVGVRAALDSGLAESEFICLATAHPAKFGDAVKLAIGEEVQLPDGLNGLDALPSRCEIMNAEPSEIRRFVEANAI